MRLLIAAIGRLKDGPDRDLADRYIKRLEQAGRALRFTPVDIIELPEARGDNVDTRKADEASRLITKLAGIEYVVAMDEHGRSLTSPAFAEPDDAAAWPRPHRPCRTALPCHHHPQWPPLSSCLSAKLVRCNIFAPGNDSVRLSKVIPSNHEPNSTSPLACYNPFASLSIKSKRSRKIDLLQVLVADAQALSQEWVCSVGGSNVRHSG
jgi:Predicted SPOUT methyltransferase